MNAEKDNSASIQCESDARTQIALARNDLQWIKENCIKCKALSESNAKKIADFEREKASDDSIKALLAKIGKWGYKALLLLAGLALLLQGKDAALVQEFMKLFAN